MKAITSFDTGMLNKFAAENSNVVWLWENTSDEFHLRYKDNFNEFCEYDDKNRILVANFVSPAIACLKAGKSEQELFQLGVGDWKLFSYWSRSVDEFIDFSRKNEMYTCTEDVQIEMVSRACSKLEVLLAGTPFADEYVRLVPDFITDDQRKLEFVQWISKFAKSPFYYEDGLDNLTEDEYAAIGRYVMNPLIVRGVWRVAAECLSDVSVRWTSVDSYCTDRPINWICIQTDKGYRLHSVWEYAEVQDAIKYLNLSKDEAPLRWSGHIHDGVFYLTKCYRTTALQLRVPAIFKKEDLVRVREIYEEQLHFKSPSDSVLNRYEIMIVLQTACGYKDWVLLLKYQELFPGVVETIKGGLPLRKYLIEVLCDGLPVSLSIQLGDAIIDEKFTVNAYEWVLSGQMQQAIDEGRSVQIGVSQNGFNIAKCSDDIAVWLSENNHFRE